MDVLVKGIDFEKLDSDRLMDFLSANRKTQVFDAKCFHGQKHLIHSILQSLKAFRGKDNIAKSEELEFLVRLSGERQIKKALARCKPRKKAVFACWADNRKTVLAKLKKDFKYRQYPLKEPGIEEIKEAIERTATFYLSS